MGSYGIDGNPPCVDVVEDARQEVMAKVIKAAGEKHTIKKNKKGEVIVDHAGKKGKYDKINLTKKAGSKTIKAGVKATKDWHKKNG